ncbi:MAG: cell division protein ZapA [Bradyrhizobiaceae bacterium]|nr:cell division protein ZapA [Bradyrhizobiaceae bacterium]
MSKTIRVTIGGKDLTLRGDDEESIKKSVREVNLQIQTLQQALREQGTQTISLLAALNLAERCISAEEGRAADVQFMTNELAKMTDLLERSWKQPL